MPAAPDKEDPFGAPGQEGAGNVSFLFVSK